MYRWRAQFRAGPPGCSEDEFILSDWFDTLEEAMRDAEKNAYDQVFEYPYLRYGRYFLCYQELVDGVCEIIDYPENDIMKH